MTSLGVKSFASIEDAMNYAMTTPNNVIASDLGITQECPLYVTDEGVEAIKPIRDAYPANAVEFIGPFHPAISGADNA